MIRQSILSRYERKSTMLMTNLAFQNRTGILGNQRTKLARYTIASRGKAGKRRRPNPASHSFEPHPAAPGIVSAAEAARPGDHPLHYQTPSTINANLPIEGTWRWASNMQPGRQLIWPSPRHGFAMILCPAFTRQRASIGIPKTTLMTNWMSRAFTLPSPLTSGL